MSVLSQFSHLYLAAARCGFLNLVPVRSSLFSFLGKSNLKVCLLGAGLSLCVLQDSALETLKHSGHRGCLLRRMLWTSICREEKGRASWAAIQAQQQPLPAPQRTLEMSQGTTLHPCSDQSLMCVILWRSVTLDEVLMRQVQKRPDGRGDPTAVGCLLTVHTANGSESFSEGRPGPHMAMLLHTPHPLLWKGAPIICTRRTPRATH